MKIRIQPPNARSGWRALSGISLSILMLAGCGGGSSGGGADFGKASVATPQVQPATEGAAPRATEQAAESTADVTGQPTADAAIAKVSALAATRLDAVSGARFLNMATFGATTGTLADLRSGTVDQWLNRQFAMTRSLQYVNSTEDFMAQWGKYDRNSVFGASATAHHLNVNMLWRAYIGFDNAQLRRRVGAALGEIFVMNMLPAPVGLGNNMRGTAAFMDILERNAFGNFRTILMDVSRSPAMGLFLSFVGNQKASYDADGEPTRVPDENYAREVMQLFSIGLYELNIDGTLKIGPDGQPIPTYTQDDVFNLARVFTGLVRASADNYTSPLIVNASAHSPEAATFLGTTVPANTPTLRAVGIAVDTLFNHPNVGPFIGKQLIQRLVTSNPSPQYVARVASVFNDNGSGERGDMRALVRAILLDEEAMNPGARPELADIQGKVREPMIRMSAVARLLGADQSSKIFRIGDLSDAFTGIGQSPLKSPSVFNFFRPGYSPPNSPIAERGLVAPEFQVVDGSAIISGINVINDFVDRAGSYVSIDVRQMENMAADPVAIVDHVSLMLTASTVDAASRADYIGLVGAIPADQRRDRVRAAIQLVAASPAFLIQK